MKIASFLALALIMFCNLNAADKYITKTGHIWFYSKTPMEVIEAHNNQAASVIDIKTGSIAFNLIIKSFKFERALMEEHFNENYIESAKFPKSTFNGKFTNFDKSNFTKNGIYKVNVEGDLNIHGVAKHVKTPGSIEVKDGKIYAKSKFSVKPEDYNIQIPGIVRDKIGKNMEITVDLVYEPFK